VGQPADVCCACTGSIGGDCPTSDYAGHRGQSNNRILWTGRRDKIAASARRSAPRSRGIKEYGVYSCAAAPLLLWLWSGLLPSSRPRVVGPHRRAGSVRRPNAEPAPFNPQIAALEHAGQPRHAKLGLAGRRRLAAHGYALKELKQGFVVTSRAVPRWRVAGADHSMPPWPAVHAPRFRDQARLSAPIRQAYDTLTKGVIPAATTDHSFVVIKARTCRHSPIKISSRALACFGEEDTIRCGGFDVPTSITASPR
jgi:hypothetical protein